VGSTYQDSQIEADNLELIVAQIRSRVKAPSRRLLFGRTDLRVAVVGDEDLAILGWVVRGYFI
jgi:hypothetical protein